jgi:hypothetical protein
LQLCGQLNGKYKKLFAVEESDGSEESEKVTKKGFEKHWGWIAVIDSLSNGDRTKWNYFTEMGVVEFLNTLAYYKDKQQELENIRWRNNQRMKA